MSLTISPSLSPGLLNTAKFANWTHADVPHATGMSFFLDDSPIDGYVCESCHDVHPDHDVCPNSGFNFDFNSIEPVVKKEVPPSPMSCESDSDEQSVENYSSSCATVDALPANASVATELEFIMARYKKSSKGSANLLRPTSKERATPYSYCGGNRGAEIQTPKPESFGSYNNQTSFRGKMRCSKSPSPSRGSSDLPGDPAEARKMYHVRAEKKRRSKENQLVRELHSVLPGNSRMPVHKPVVMRSAIEYINYLVNEELPNARSVHTKQLMEEVMALRRENAVLRRSVQSAWPPSLSAELLSYESGY